MNQNERLNYLINYLLEDLHLDKDLFFGEDLFTTYRKLVNIREAKPVSKKFLEILDEMLQEENRKKGIVSFFLSDGSCRPMSRNHFYFIG